MLQRDTKQQRFPWLSFIHSDGPDVEWILVRHSNVYISMALQNGTDPWFTFSVVQVLLLLEGLSTKAKKAVIRLEPRQVNDMREMLEPKRGLGRKRKFVDLKRRRRAGRIRHSSQVVAKRSPPNCRQIHISDRLLLRIMIFSHVDQFIRSVPRDLVIQCEKQIPKRTTALKMKQACDPGNCL